MNKVEHYCIRCYWDNSRDDGKTPPTSTKHIIYNPHRLSRKESLAFNIDSGDAAKTCRAKCQWEEENSCVCQKCNICA